MNAFSQIRSQYPVTQHCAYLDHAAAGPISRAVYDAIRTLSDDHLNFGTQNHQQWTSQHEKVRQDIGKLLNVPATQIAFTQNTSDGVSLLANGLAWQAGDNVVLSAIEFPSNFYAWKRLESLGVDVRLVPAPRGFVTIDEFAKQVDAKTRLLAVSYVQYSSGYRYPLEQLANLCHDHGALLFVDGTQGVGALSLDATTLGVDVLAVSAHKWMLGPLGIGFIYFSRPALDKTQPRTLGWLSVVNPFDFDYQLRLPDDARRFEAGTENALGIVGLGASLQVLHGLGIDAIEAQVLSLTERLCDGLKRAGHHVVSPRKQGEASGIVVFKPARCETEAMHCRLSKARVVCCIRNGGIRISPHYYNNSDEIDHALTVIGETS